MPKKRQEKNLATINQESVWDRIAKSLGAETIRQIANTLGLTDAAVWQWKHSGQIPSLDNLIKIARLSSTSIEWLITGEEPAWIRNSTPIQTIFTEGECRAIEKMARKEGIHFEEVVHRLTRQGLIEFGLDPDTEKSVTIEYFGEKVPIPLVGEIIQGKPIKALTEMEKVYVAKTFRDSDMVFALRVRGTGLEADGFKDGDLLIVIQEKEIPNGQLIVAIIEHKNAFVKRCFLEKNTFRLQATNPPHNPVTYTKEQVEIQGIVIGVQH
ncbi:MAG: helix-turn-helix domain-containing protein [Blastocatellia bacterium]|nr:helix-turn-helix domain-containing protein [Blastocatellia bacterium]